MNERGKSAPPTLMELRLSVNCVDALRSPLFSRANGLFRWGKVSTDMVHRNPTRQNKLHDQLRRMVLNLVVISFAWTHR